MINIFDDIPKYRKKSSVKPPKKSRHKHVYEPCLIEIPTLWYGKPHERAQSRTTYLNFKAYCPICGKLESGDQDRWFRSDKKFHSDGTSYIEVSKTEEAIKEINPTTRTIPSFKVDSPFDKFVDIVKE